MALYAFSDAHLGSGSLELEEKKFEKISALFEKVKEDGDRLVILGDLFDFWFEYSHAVPKGFVRFLGKIANLVDRGIPVYFFTGNHDMWMFHFFEEELNIPVFHHPISFCSSSSPILKKKIFFLLT